MFVNIFTRLLFNPMINTLRNKGSLNASCCTHTNNWPQHSRTLNTGKVLTLVEFCISSLISFLFHYLVFSAGTHCGSTWYHRARSGTSSVHGAQSGLPWALRHPNRTGWGKRSKKLRGTTLHSGFCSGLYLCRRRHCLLLHPG